MIGTQRSIAQEPVSDTEPEPGPAVADAPEPPLTELPLDVTFGILKNQRRRRVLRYLLDESPQITLGELAEHIAALENEKSIEALTSSERKRVYVCLYQCHLPKMDDAGVIDFEENRGTVEVADNAEQLRPFLDTADETAVARPWSRYYLAAALAGGATFGSQQLLFPSAIATVLVVAGLLAALVGVAIGHGVAEGTIAFRLPWDRSDQATAAE